MKNQLLPIGSIVTLDSAEKKLMIIGITMESEETGKMFDYMGVPYPEGYIDDDFLFLFNQKDIAGVSFIGFVNAESQAFRVQHAQAMEEAGLSFGEIDDEDNNTSVSE